MNNRQLVIVIAEGLFSPSAKNYNALATVNYVIPNNTLLCLSRIITNNPLDYFITK
ncbi:hypothetical protein RHO12_00930 [Orbus sturtevantii]|uniref:hypothetical protein n=1 Tax=Orbus sturtevantii TaxID=3074109 RepID=UPI00370D898C